jgi:glucosamine-6-phosphate deaminase
MEIIISETRELAGIKAAQTGAGLIRKAILDRGEANIILATGASQFEMLDELVRSEVDWSRVTVFHLDEYIGLTENHDASFRKYLKERFADRVSVKQFVYVNGNTDPHEECVRLGKLISRHPIDVALVGIGENGHLAFNDPPADFDTEEPYIVVTLDEACRRQQLGEGWFKTLADVPAKAISMSIRQIMKSGSIICTVPDERKAIAVSNTLYGEISPDCPASILREHPRVLLYLDSASASLTTD